MIGALAAGRVADRIGRRAQVLRRLGAEGDIEAEIEAEIDEVHKVAAKEKEGSARELLSRGVRPALWVGVLLAVFQQVTGINTVILVRAVAAAGRRLRRQRLAARERRQRRGQRAADDHRDPAARPDRPAAIAAGGTAGMAVGMVLTGCAFLGGDTLHGAAPGLAIAGLLVYTGSFAIGLGPVFWLMIAEIYPLRIRGQAMSVATIANWGANFVVNASVLTLLNAITPKGGFFLFAFLTVVALVYLARRVPETKQRPLGEIERDLGATMTKHGALEAPPRADGVRAGMSGWPPAHPMSGRQNVAHLTVSKPNRESARA